MRTIGARSSAGKHRAYGIPAHRTGWIWLMLVGLTGCASVDLRAGFPDVSAAVEERSATKIAWNRGTELDQEAAEQLRSLLRR